MTDRRRVVITGLGVATPIGIGMEPFWDALLNRQCGVRRIASFDPSAFPAQIAGELPPFTISEYIPKAYRKSTKVMSRDIMIAVMCAYHAAKDAGLNTKCLVERGEATGAPNVDPTRFGANIGAGLVCADLDELGGALTTAAENGQFSIAKWGGEGMTNLTPLWLLKFLPNMLACHVTIVHDAQAPSNTITCGEASSHLAIGEAFRTISRGAADVCICGGAESRTSPMALTRPLLAERLNRTANEHPERACMPFSAQRSGGVVAEGGGLIILEELSRAKARGAKIYAEIAGFGASTSAFHWANADVSGRAMQLALGKALKDAQVQPDQVQLMNPFGTGIPAFDAGEIAGFNAVFGDALSRAAAFTTRGSLGSCGAGAGAIDVAACAMAIHRNTVPPSLNTQPADPASRFKFATGDPMDGRAVSAVSVGYAPAGGQHAALVLRKYQD